MLSLRPLGPALALAAVATLAAAQTPEPPAPRVRQVCAADIQKLCPDVQPGHGAVMQCMRSHFQEVSPDCHAAVLARREAMKERRAEAMRNAAGANAAPPNTTPPTETQVPNPQ